MNSVEKFHSEKEKLGLKMSIVGQYFFLHGKFRIVMIYIMIFHRFSQTYNLFDLHIIFACCVPRERAFYPNIK